MDSTTAVGLASSILTFVHFTSAVLAGSPKVLRTCRYKSDGVHMSRVHADLKKLTRAIIANQALCPPERHQDLMDLAALCQTVSRDMSAMLDGLQASRGSSWDKIRATIRSVRKSGGMADMQARVDRCRGEILTRFKAIFDKQHLVLQLVLWRIHPDKPRPNMKLAVELRRLRDYVLDPMERDLSVDAKHRSLVHDVRNAVARLVDTAAYPSPEVLVLRQLGSSLNSSSSYPYPSFCPVSRPGAAIPFGPGYATQAPDILTFSWAMSPVDPFRASGDENDSRGIGPVEAERESIESDNTDSGLDLTTQKKPESSSKMRARARWSLASWLEAGDGILHISGRAGSGKSALMSFLAKETETRIRLENWAGKRELVFIPTLVGPAQRSRPSLYRSILFEVLHSMPGLVHKVLPEAYAACRSCYPANVVEDVFFNPDALERAFETLVSLDIGDDCRVCLFVDGLDEYTGSRAWEEKEGGGGSERQAGKVTPQVFLKGMSNGERMDRKPSVSGGSREARDGGFEGIAEQMWKWVGDRKVKILVSSRPCLGASSKFPERITIQLEELNDLDIEAWCRRTLEVDGGCDEIVSLYGRYIRAIVRKAEGNFLWARLATRSLLGDVLARLPPKGLEAKVESLPRDLGDMYALLFDSVAEAERATIFKMLLLVAGHPARLSGRGTIDSVHLSWVDDLDDPNFPLNRPRAPYSPVELELRQRRVRYRIETSAQPLLVFKEATDAGGSAVEFAHRTVYEWVRKNKQMQRFSSRVSSADTYTRIALAELWFESSLTAPIGGASWWLSVPSLDQDGYLCRKELLDGFIRIHAKHGGLYTLYGRSFLHRLAYSHHIGHYFKWKAAQYELIEKDGAPELSLLASSLLGGQVENVRALLELGMSPWRSLQVRSHIHTRHVEVSIWVVYLWNFAEMVIYGLPGPDLDVRGEGDVSVAVSPVATEYWVMLKMLLQAGCDPECTFLLSDRKDNIPSHAISLRRLISNSRKPESVEIPMSILRGSHHPGVTGCRPYGLYKQERIPGLGDGCCDIDRARYKLVSVKCGNEELEWPFSRVHVY